MSYAKIRIALVVRPAAGGICSHLATLLANLDGDRFTVTLFAPADFADFAEASGVPLIPLAITPRLSPLHDRVILREFAQHLTGNYDLIHAHGVRAAWIAAHTAFRVNLPHVFTAHNVIPPLGRLARFGLKFTAGFCQRVIAVSEAVSASLQQNGVAAEKIVVIPNGVAIAAFDAPFDAAAFRAGWNIPPRAPLLVAVGRLAPEKGFDVLLRAFPRVQSEIPDARLLLAGAGPERRRLEARAAGSPAITFAGHAAQADAFLRSADVVVLPSRREGQGIVALEAMAARKPVVASRVGGLVETIVEKETGLLVPPDDPPALALALASLLKDAARRDAMGNAGRRRVEQNYAAPRMAQQTAAIYEAARRNEE